MGGLARAADVWCGAKLNECRYSAEVKNFGRIRSAPRCDHDLGGQDSIGRERL